MEKRGGWSVVAHLLVAGPRIGHVVILFSFCTVQPNGLKPIKFSTLSTSGAIIIPLPRPKNKLVQTFRGPSSHPQKWLSRPLATTNYFIPCSWLWTDCSTSLLYCSLYHSRAIILQSETRVSYTFVCFVFILFSGSRTAADLETIHQRIRTDPLPTSCIWELQMGPQNQFLRHLPSHSPSTRDSRNWVLWSNPWQVVKHNKGYWEEYAQLYNCTVLSLAGQEQGQFCTTLSELPISRFVSLHSSEFFDYYRLLKSTVSNFIRDISDI